MEKEKLEGVLIDYIDGKLNAVDRHVLEQELITNEDSRKLYEELKEVIQAMEGAAPLNPSSDLKIKFNEILNDEIAATRSGARTIVFRPAFYRVAAAIALLVIFGAVGFWINRNNTQLAQIEKEMELTRKQLAETKNAMLAMLENQQSASQRIKGVNVAMQLQDADDETVKALFNTMQSDPNTNVRLAALEALSRFQELPEVRKGLIDALSKQKDPMVQITLIQLMVQMREKTVVHELQKMVDDARTMKAVKDEAYSGILKLS